MKVFKLVELGEVRAFVSASCMTDIFYVARKKLSTSVARTAIAGLLELFEVVDVGVNDLKDALTMDIIDFEDALQAWLFTKVSTDVLITRDISGFPRVDTVSPTDFVRQ